MRRVHVLTALVTVGTALVVAGLFGQAVFALDNFVITNYEVDMKLSRDSESRSTLRTTETITADFQARDENHGLERNFVKTYKEHSTSFHLESVTDENGNELPYHWSGDALRIGDADTYVFGVKTYKLTYTERDVTANYADTAKDEFYWDVIGTEWRVPIEKAFVRLKIDPSITDAVQTEVQCYVGEYGSTKTCDTSEEQGVYSAAAENIGNYSGLTLSLGFAPGTFQPYQPSLIERLAKFWGILTVVTSIVAIGLIVWLGVRAYRWTYRSAEIGTIVPEYLPPKNASVAASAAVSPGLHNTMAAQLTDLAVRHYIQILEVREKTRFKPAEYDITVVRDITELRSEEQEILSDMFGYSPKVGDRMSLESLQNNSAAFMRFSDNDAKLRDLMRQQYALKRIDEGKRGWFMKVAKVTLIAGIITLSPLMIIAAIDAFALSKLLWVLSDEGLSLRRYLKGLEMYIKVAEEERLKMLQSPEGVEKVALEDPTNPAQLVKLYEKVLPFAVLFGQEKEWGKRLGDIYASTDTSPDWYSGNTAFNGAVFGSMMNNFSSAVSTASASSSSSGGSGGGGFSGGGGGGGGGGGW